MKILQINSVYKNGSTGKIMYDIHNVLTNLNKKSVVCYGRGKKIKEDNVYKVCGEIYSHFNHFIANISGVPYARFFFSTQKLVNIIKKEKPDIVHIHCLNGYFVNIYRLIEWLKKNKIKTVLTLHAEFMYTGGCGYSLDCNKWVSKQGCYNCDKLKTEFHSIFFDRTNYMWKRMIKAFNGFDNDKIIIASVSPWLMKRAKQSYALKDFRHVVVMNGLDTSIFHNYDDNETLSLKKKNNLSNEKIILHVTPFFNDNPNHIKGGYYVIELAKLMINENVKIIVAGPYEKKITVPDNVILLGPISDQTELAKYYSMADLTLLTSKKETFSMVTAESLSCGTPIVGFKAGAPEMIALKEYSEFVEYGNCNELCKACMKMLNKQFDINKIDTYAKKTMVNNYIRLYKILQDE